jgi:hypothetical protein
VFSNAQFKRYREKFTIAFGLCKALWNTRAGKNYFREGVAKTLRVEARGSVYK